MRLRQIGVIVALVAWGLVSLAQLTRLVEPPAPPPGQEVVPLLDLARQTIPPDAGYLYIEPGAFGTDSGAGPRLRYELYPRRYDDVRAPVDEQTVRDLLRSEDLGFIVVPDLDAYPPGYWLRQPPAWLRPERRDEPWLILRVVAP